MLVKLAVLAPVLAPAAAQRGAVTWLDVDDTMRRTYGYATQGVGFGYNKVKGLNALLAVAAVLTAGARFCSTARMDPAIQAAITTIDQDA